MGEGISGDNCPRRKSRDVQRKGGLLLTSIKGLGGGEAHDSRRDFYGKKWKGKGRISTKIYLCPALKAKPALSQGKNDVTGKGRLSR